MVVRPNKSSEMKVSEVSPYRNMRSKRGNEGQGRGVTTDTIRHVLNMIKTDNATRKAEEEKSVKENKRYEKSRKNNLRTRN